MPQPKGKGSYWKLLQHEAARFTTGTGENRDSDWCGITCFRPGVRRWQRRGFKPSVSV